MLDFDKLKEIVLKNDSFVITSHVNPDADAIGSELALYRIFARLGKKINIINFSKTPYFLEFMDPDGKIEKYDSAIHDSVIDSAQVLMIVDLNRLDRLVKMESVFRSAKGIKVCIDHHTEPENFGNLELIDINYSSTGAIIYDFLKITQIAEIDLFVAELLYAAIMTDTGSFRFDRTTSETHIRVADLISKGADPYKIYQLIFEQNRIGKLKLLGEALRTLELHADGQIAHMIVTQQMLISCEGSEDEVDGFVNYSLGIKGVKIGILFFELKDGIKISFRGKSGIFVNKLAKKFGGGGHVSASGTRLFNCTLEEYLPVVLSEAEKYLI